MTLVDRISGVNGGLGVKAPARAATTANIALSGLISVDGVALTEGDRVLVKDQSNATQNGVWSASSGVWSRAVDFDGTRDIVKGTRVFVTDGAANKGLEYYVTTNNPIIVDTSQIAFEVALTTGGSTVPQSRTVTTTEGIQGGGNLSANRTLKLDVSGLGTLPSSTPDSGDYFPLYDLSASTHVKITWGNLSASFVPATRTVGTDTGLSGGGALSSNRTIALDINALSSPASVDTGADYVLIYDTSAGAHRKATPNELFTGVEVNAANLTGGPLPASTLPNSGAVSGTYGDGDSVAQIAVDQYGRVTSASNVNIAIPFSAVSDGPGAFTGQLGKFIRVNGTETGLEFAAGAAVSEFTDLSDVPPTYSGAGGQFLRVKATEDGLELASGAAVSAFTDLTDTPGTLAGQGGKVVAVNSGGTALEFLSDVPANSVPTAAIEAAAVTLAKLENRAQGTLIGRYSSGSGVPQAITISTGLTYNGGNLALDVDSLTAETGIVRASDYIPLYDASAGALRKATPDSIIGASLKQIADLVDPNADRIIFWDDSAGAYTFLTVGTGLTISGTSLTASGSNPTLPIGVACSDETTALTTGTSKTTIHMPFDFTLSEVIGGLTTAQTSGNIFTVDVNKNGTTVLSTRITIDNTETSSVTAATPAVISVTSFSKGDRVSFDIDQIGDGTAKGLKVYLIGAKT